MSDIIFIIVINKIKTVNVTYFSWKLTTLSWSTISIRPHLFFAAATYPYSLPAGAGTQLTTLTLIACFVLFLRLSHIWNSTWIHNKTPPESTTTATAETMHFTYWPNVNMIAKLHSTHAAARDTRKLHSTAASSARCLRYDNVTLTFGPKNLISSSLSQDAPVTKVWGKSINRYWRYHGKHTVSDAQRDVCTDGHMHARHMPSSAEGLKTTEWPSWNYRQDEATWHDIISAKCTPTVNRQPVTVTA